MRLYYWAELLDEEDLLQLTGEALPEGPAGQRRWSWRKLGAAAACAALLACVMNVSRSTTVCSGSKSVSRMWQSM